MRVLDCPIKSYAVAGVVALACLVFVASGVASTAALPNPCTLLARAHPERTFGAGKMLAVKDRKLQKYGSGLSASASCSETVGTQPVVLSLFGAGAGGYAGVKVTSQTHPSGLGSGAALIVGTAAGGGGPVDFVVFHKSSVYVDASANGASPTVLTTFARQIYKALP